uniref:Uncharacterized protein n=1 Tax=Steinernema glaseri TaxID=37863 RepID=A0A1I7YN79_9BILA
MKSDEILAPAPGPNGPWNQSTQYTDYDDTQLTTTTHLWLRSGRPSRRGITYEGYVTRKSLGLASSATKKDATASLIDGQ